MKDCLNKVIQHTLLYTYQNESQPYDNQLPRANAGYICTSLSLLSCIHPHTCLLLMAIRPNGRSAVLLPSNKLLVAIP